MSNAKFHVWILCLFTIHGIKLVISQVIGPAQWDEDVLGIYWTLVMGSAASEKHEKEERTEAHEAKSHMKHMKPPDLAIPLV